MSSDFNARYKRDGDWTDWPERGYVSAKKLQRFAK